MFARPFISAVARAFVSRLVRVAAISGVAMTLATPAHAQEAGTARALHRPHGTAVTQWNATATDAFAPTQGTNPMVQSRTLAILHAAIHDALNAIDQRFESYTPGLAATPEASVAKVLAELLATTCDTARQA